MPSTVQIMFGRIPVTDIPVLAAGFSSNEIITSGASTTTTTIVAKQGDSVVQITNTGAAVYVNIAPTPVAVADDTSILILDSTTRDFAVNVGDKVAVIDA